ncbi:hypothetical protein F4827_005594 [Paraburkholderia bannensis]|uniref:Uncharacterized protein n=1 Tax=Paraburkholderia bannensis TaxID=765414 RepID=A0A7W9U292_9BURK|nr:MULTISPECIES: hypothetical protein [Paraburkholderia]MBB3260819.1 hypothetical protein [Paraburkholderia sp. WP4_3_2]MBB6105724.1 hypothetical protein [Paraburkholderia bannensis]
MSRHIALWRIEHGKQWTIASPHDGIHTISLQTADEENVDDEATGSPSPASRTGAQLLVS